jgi:mono/diheme cytochrome c family protein
MTDIRFLRGLTLMIALLASCQSNPAPKRDVMLEASAAFKEDFDAPFAQGRSVYGKYCSVCHGVEGKGDGFNAFNLNPRPRNFTDSAFRARFDKRLVKETISKGGNAVGLAPLMPPWGHTLTGRDIELVSQYVEYLAGGPSR